MFWTKKIVKRQKIPSWKIKVGWRRGTGATSPPPPNKKNTHLNSWMDYDLLWVGWCRASAVTVHYHWLCRRYVTTTLVQIRSRFSWTPVTLDKSLSDKCLCCTYVITKLSPA